MSAAHATETRPVVGRYVLFGEIASGGMATVHFGRLQGAAGFARSVAIKRLHPQYAKDPEFVSMFVDEARLAARISHPNVVPTLDVVSQGDELLLVMEYVRGTSLSRLFRTLTNRGEKIPPAIAASIVAGALHGLHAAHEAKSETGERLDIVHRDVSPQNILVGTDGVARVLDFGVAKAAGRWQSTREGQLKGKIAYMAPEQITTGQVTRRTDVYAASAVFWEMLTGKRLFRADSEVKLLMMVIESAVQAPSTVAPGLPEGLDAIVLRGLDRNPEKRFATAREMASHIERAVPVAPAAEVGEWLEQVAADELRERANRIEEIERSMPSVRTSPSETSIHEHRSSSRSGIAQRFAQTAFPANAIAPLPGAMHPHAPEVAPPSGPAPREGRRSIAVVAAMVLALSFAVGLAASLRTSRQKPSVEPNRGQAAMQAAGEGAVPVGSSSPGDPSGAPPSEVKTSVWTPIPFPSTTSVAPTSIPTVAPNALPMRPTRTGRPTGLVKPPVPPDCTPPFTTDSKGHVHFKPACVN